MKKLPWSFVLCILATLPHAVFAGDAALYDKEPPANAAFFRFLNTSEATTLKVEFNGENIATLEPLEVSPFGFTDQSQSTFTFNGTDYPANTASKSICTLVWNGQDVTRIDEEMFSSKSKARIKLCNMANGVVSLKTPDGKTDVIAEVAPGRCGYRDVNALTMPFSFYAGGTEVLSTENVALKKGRATTLFLLESGTNYVYTQSNE